MAVYNLSGINTNNIPKMKSAITTYKNHLTKKANISATNTKIQAAIKGSTVEAQVRTLAQVINNKIIALFQELDAFNSKLDEIAALYKDQDTTATAVSDVTGSIKS